MYRKNPIEKIIAPISRFIINEKAGGIVLGISVLLALFLANFAPFSKYYFEILEMKIGLQFNGQSYLEHDILHWINDGLMAIFFFVIGLELKKEFVGGELSNPRKAILPVGAAFGGMLVPALIYIVFNPLGEVHQGWGIPMATDIAFSLAVLYTLGKKVPLSLKVFLTAVAVVDDLGAVIVIAFFYTSEISVVNLLLGLGAAFLMFIGNKAGIRNILFYAVLGIGGVWLAFLLSGVHATIAAVLAAFMIPADVKIKEDVLLKRIRKHLNRFNDIGANDKIPTLTEQQLFVLEKAKEDFNRAIPPLQRLEYHLHSFSTFIVLPVFALANAGVSLTLDMNTLFNTNIVFGVMFGLFFGKVTGISGATFLLTKTGIALKPDNMTFRNLLGIGLLAGIGFTMSLFVTSLAFTNPEYETQAKIGIFTASILAAVSGYLVLRSNKNSY
ncbi:MAG: Na+/H+ antiporter NhaA [Prevotellaceae bacterium]|jgi:NhaA family Na+:H+ antiporter|nr:Na+/H+ antiporter NhaA [Prevotellaceae bacterium]